MTTHTEQDRCLALAGVFQTAELVQAVARGRSPDPTALRASLGSIFVQSLDRSIDAFGGAASGLRIGLSALSERLSGPSPREAIEPTRYAIALLHLERRLHRRPQLLRAIGERIRHSHRLVELHGLEHPAVTQALAELYRDTLSTLGPRIMVSGDPQALRDPGRQGLIRALLLAGIRAAVLWRQCGGSRWALLFRRRVLVRMAQKLLSSA